MFMSQINYVSYIQSQMNQYAQSKTDQGDRREKKKKKHTHTHTKKTPQLFQSQVSGLAIIHCHHSSQLV